MRAIVKIAGTVAVTVLLGYPLWAPQWGGGILGEVAGLPPAAALGESLRPILERDVENTRFTNA